MWIINKTYNSGTLIVPLSHESPKLSASLGSFMISFNKLTFVIVCCVPVWLLVAI